jgi:hypothetical protein
MSSGKNDKDFGYEGGKGRTFTPTTTAPWIKEFNETLETSGKSRNFLTELLIKEGLKVYNKGNADELFLSARELAFLKTTLGRQTLQILSESYFSGEQDIEPKPIRKIISNEPSHIQEKIEIKKEEKISFNQEQQNIIQSAKDEIKKLTFKK